jgi:hypothetical protein
MKRSIVHSASATAARTTRGGPIDAMRITLGCDKGQKVTMLFPLAHALAFAMTIGQCGADIAAKAEGEEGGLPS